MPSNRPRGRRPGNADTRAEIIDAALRLFSTEGYDKVSLRQVAREADVDPALIHHYFENKADLFTIAVIATPVEDPADAVRIILDGPRETVGERAVDIIIATFERPGANQRFLALLRASMNAGPRATRSASSSPERSSPRSRPPSSIRTPPTAGSSP